VSYTVRDRKAEAIYHDVTSFLRDAERGQANGEGSEWGGGDSYRTCARYAITGWDTEVEPTNAIARRITDVVFTDRALAPDVTTRYDVSGAEVDIDRFLHGEPECLVDLIPRQVARAGRAVRLVVHNGVRADISADVYRRRGAAVVALIDALQAVQHPLEIWAGSDAQFTSGYRSSRSSERWSYLVQIQSASDPLDIGRVVFFASHPGAHRNLGFAIRTSPDAGGHHDVGGSHPLGPSCVPDDHTGTTIVLPQLTEGSRWTEAECAAWVEQQLDLLGL
jgi:hypothetical protein